MTAGTGSTGSRRRARPARILPPLLVAVAALLVVAAPARGQRVEETRLLREAAALESGGELEAAEARLRTLLRRAPTSAGGLFALERVLRARGRVSELLAVADTFLAYAPEASGVRHLKLRVLADVDSTEALEETAAAWFALEPGNPEPYREVSRIWERALGPEAALDVLRTGRAAVGRSDALALETGDLLAAVGRLDGAVEEWAEALAADPGMEDEVSQRLRGLPSSRERGRRVVERLVENGAGEDARLRSAASLAVELGLEEEAGRVVRTLAERLDGRERGGFLAGLARRADDEGMARLAAWAWGVLGQAASTPGERRQFDQRLVEASLAAGDTASALEAQRRVAGSYTDGSVDQRRARARVIRLEAAHAGPDRLQALLSEFRTRFPEAPELDELGATVAERLMERGEVAAAAAALEGIDGPRSNTQRGWILMSRGEVALGRQALLMAIPGLPPEEATGIIQFAGLLGRLSPAGVALLAEARVEARAGRPREAADRLADGVAGLPEEERAPLLAEAARLVEETDAERAAELRRTLLEEHWEAAEAGEAALELARALVDRPGGREEAVALLERLITERPRAAVVPVARRELERLKEEG